MFCFNLYQQWKSGYKNDNKVMEINFISKFYGNRELVRFKILAIEILQITSFLLAIPCSEIKVKASL
jgi:hypothetical protein